MKEINKISALLVDVAVPGLLLLFLACKPLDNSNSNDLSYKVEKHIVQAYMGEQHLANLVYRKGSDGDKFVGWGRTPITEWTVGSTSKRQVVPFHPDHRYSNGGCALDLDGDGVEEIITARGTMSNLSDATLMWFKELDGEGYWKGHEMSMIEKAPTEDEYQPCEFHVTIKNQLYTHEIADIWPASHSSPHDIVPYIRENELKSVIANKSRKEVHMFVVPDDLKYNWQHYKIGTFPADNHSGMEIRDINGDGFEDIVSGNFWIEAPADPTDVPWKFHRFSEWDERGKNRWGGMNKHGVADFDGDGTYEIVTSEAEIPDARLSLFDRQSEDGTGLWKEFVLDSGLEAPHSLVVVDINNDGREDIIVGEMTAGGWNFPYNPNPKLYAYINQGDLKFEKYILYEGWGVHEMRLFPKLYEDKIMIYAADEIQPQKFKMNTHVSFWLINSK